MRPADTGTRRTDTAIDLETGPERRRRGRGVVLALAPVALAVTGGLALAGGGAQVVAVGAPVVQMETTTTTVASTGACRNSNSPACGPFRFQPEPGPDSPMTAQVAVEPASPRAGQEVVFRVTLTDPDGVSYGSSILNFGDSGQSGAPFRPCDKFGAWEPPGPSAAGTELIVLRHAYAQAGTYTATFTFDAGPFGCVDAATGRGDRPYASSATASVTVEVR